MNILDKLGLSDEQFINKQTIADLKSPLSTEGLLNQPKALELGSFDFSNTENNSLQLNFNAGAEASIQLFNASDQTDSDQMLAINGNDGFVPYSTNTPVLKYLLSLKAGLDGKTSIGKLDLGIEANASLEAMAYLKHEPTNSLAEALIVDMQSLPSIASALDVSAMKEGDAVAIETQAKLGASLSFELNDVFTAGLSGLSKVLDSSKLISLDISSGVKIGASYGLEDTYQLIFVKDTSTLGYDLKVSVKKANTKSTSASASAGVSVGFTDPEVFSNAVNAKIDSLVSQVVGITDDVYDQISQKIESGVQSLDLNAEEQAAAQKLLQHFGIADIPEKYQELKEKLEALKSEIQTNITEAAKNKLEVSIGFEYSKVSTKSTLLTASLNSSLLTANNGQIFKQLILFNPQPLIDSATNPDTSSKISVQDFLKEEMTKTSSKWGISIGFGKFKLGGADTTTKEFSVSTNLEDQQKVSFDGVRGYQEKGSLGGWTHQWSVGFNPEMPNFSAAKTPTPQEFNNSFSLMIEEVDAKFKGKNDEKTKIEQILATAVCWGIVPIANFDQTLNTIWNTLENGEKKASATFNISLNFTPAAFKSVWTYWFQLLNNQKAYDAFLAKAFGMTVPYLADEDAKKNADAVQSTYTSIWNAYFKNNLSPGAVSATAENALQGLSGPLSRLEKNSLPGTMSFVVQKNPATHSRWKSFDQGIKSYLSYYHQNEYPDFEQNIQTAFKEMKAIWAQSFDTKVFGTYLMKLADENKVLSEIDSVLTVSYTDANGNSKQMVFKNA